jgi:mRNA-degrading endonuclease toxin of MazEF toxin-antitoxin module
MTLPEELISRKIGTLSEKRMKEVERKLKKLYGIK